MKKVLRYILIFALVGAILGFFIGPWFYIAPSCSLDQVTGAIQSCMKGIVSYQTVGSIAGGIIGGIIGFVISKFKK